MREHAFGREHEVDGRRGPEHVAAAAFVPDDKVGILHVAEARLVRHVGGAEGVGVGEVVGDGPLPVASDHGASIADADNGGERVAAAAWRRERALIDLEGNLLACCQKRSRGEQWNSQGTHGQRQQQRACETGGGQGRGNRKATPASLRKLLSRLGGRHARRRHLRAVIKEDRGPGRNRSQRDAQTRQDEAPAGDRG